MATNGSQVPPHATECEKSFLGLVLANNDVLDDPACQLQESDFYKPSHQFVYRKAREYHEDGRLWSMETALDELDEDHVDAAAVVSGMATNGYISARIDRLAEYVSEIRNAAIERERYDLRQEHSRALRNGAGDGEIAEIETRLLNLGSRRQTPAASKVDAYLQFPVDALPEPIRSFVIEAAAAIGCDSSYVALPVLPVLASAIGSTRRLQLKRGWNVPPILWTGIVGESGTQKSPPWRLAMKPLFARQRREFQKQAKHEREDETENSQSTANTEAVRYVVSDTTVESLAPILKTNERGVLMSRDELSGWLGSFNQYKSGKSSADEAHWLSAYNGEPIIVDRKGGDPKTIFVPHAFICVTGGIQPEVLRRSLGREHCESGLAARFIFANPPRKTKRWTEAEISPETEKEYAAVVNRLLDLPGGTDPEGNPEPKLLQCFPEAKDRFVEFFEKHAEEMASMEGDLAAAWSKLEEMPARLAIIIHETKHYAAHGDNVAGETMAAAIEITEWAKREARRLYGMWSETDEQRKRRELLEWIESQGGDVSVTKTAEKFRRSRFPTNAAAEAALRDLAARGHGTMAVKMPTGRGRPSDVFRLTKGVSESENR